MYPYFLCLWDCTDRGNHYKKKIWPKRMSLERGCRKVINGPLVELSERLLPLLHIKLGLIKQFVKALNKEGQCFQYIMSQFSQWFDAKIREGTLDGPQILKLLKDNVFVTGRKVPPRYQSDETKISRQVG